MAPNIDSVQSSTTLVTGRCTHNNSVSFASQKPVVLPVRKLRVVIVTPVFPPNLAVGGGVAVTYGALERKLLQRGHDVLVLSSRLQNVDYGSSVLYPGFPVIMPTLANIRRFYKAIHAADVVVAPETSVLPILSLIAHWAEIPLMMNVHTNIHRMISEKGFLGRYLFAPVMDSVMKMISFSAARTMTTSPSYRKVLEARGYRVDDCFSPRIKTAIFESTDDSDAEIEKAREWLSAGQPQRPLLLYVGRWSREKSIEKLIKYRPKQAVLAIVGDGPIANEILKWHNPSEGVVVLRGMKEQSRLRVLYKAADLHVSASAFETLGMTVAEAHLCGTPVAVQDAPGFVTQVIEGKNGFLIDYHGDQNKCIKQLEHAIEHRPTRDMVLENAVSWDGDLVRLEEEVERMADEPPCNWSCPHLPKLLCVVIFVIYYIVQALLTFPFNRVLYRVPSYRQDVVVDASSVSTKESQIVK